MSNLVAFTGGAGIGFLFLFIVLGSVTCLILGIVFLAISLVVNP